MTEIENETNGVGADSETHVALTIPAKPEYVVLCRLALSGLARLRPLDDDTLADVAEGGIAASFLDDRRKRELIADVEAWLGT